MSSAFNSTPIRVISTGTTANNNFQIAIRVIRSSSHYIGGMGRASGWTTSLFIFKVLIGRLILILNIETFILLLMNTLIVGITRLKIFRNNLFTSIKCITL